MNYPSYDEFIRSKVKLDHGHGYSCEWHEVHPALKDHQKAIVCWAVRGGRRAIFSAFGLGKTVIQLEALRIMAEKSAGSRSLIVAPLSVRQEFIRDGMDILGIAVAFIRSHDEASGPGCYITNYESIRDGKLDPRHFDIVTLDEASILRGFGGTKTFREFMRLFEGTQLFRFVATATPSPNDYIELLAYAAFLDVMDVGQAKTRFFKRDSTKADKLTIHPHKEREFWLWVSSWAIFVQKPSDLGFSDEGYNLPPITVRWHEVPTNHDGAGNDPSGQGRLLKNASLGVVESSREKRDSLGARVSKMVELRNERPDDHVILWHDLEDERRAIEKAIPSAVSVYGSQDLEERTQAIIDFSDGKIKELAAKPVIAGSGCNFQRHCSWAIFVGIGFKFNDFIQAIHRIQRFLQSEPVVIDLIYTEAEAEVRVQLERKWRQHEELVARMTEIIKEYGLSSAAMAHSLMRGIGVERQEYKTDYFHLVHNDTVVETAMMESDSVDLILTSPPFSTQYEYSPNLCDFGHTDDNEHFWQQMDYLTPQLLRVLKPGRLAVIHVKDRIVPSGLTGRGYQTVYPFSDETIRHFVKHGFGFLARKTIVTDVVRENNQTYRLGWSEQCKDGTKMGCGMPEYLLYFRKDPTDTSNSYADEPVIKNKADYTRTRWQIDAHGFMRSSGNRFITEADLSGTPHDLIFRMYREHSLSHVYDFEHHVSLGESLERCDQCGHIHVGDKGKCLCGCTGSGRLPVTFMLLQPQSWHPDVWSDITRMRTLNGAQSAKGKEMHLCPMQFDIADRVISQLSMRGEVVFDPFSGLGTVPSRAVKLGRFGRGHELSPGYYTDSIVYCKAAAEELTTPTLFGLISAEDDLVEVAS